MIDEGYIKLSRRFFKNEHWSKKRIFSMSEAWLDLIQLARFDQRPAEITLPSGHRISIERGEVRASLRYLSERWGWSLFKTKKFIDKHIEKHKLKRRTEQGETVIKLCNYGLYNPLAENDQTPNQTPNQTPTNTNNKKVKKEKEIQPALRSQARAIFEQHYKDLFAVDYYWTGKDAGSMTQLIRKITFQHQQKGVEPTDESILGALRHLLQSVREGWIFENFSVTNINSKFNEIIAKARNEHNREKQQQQQADGIIW